MQKILMILRYFDVAESENDIGFSELAIDFEIFLFFIFGEKNC